MTRAFPKSSPEVVELALHTILADAGNPELLTEGRTGHIVPCDDLQAMAASLVSLARDPAG